MLPINISRNRPLLVHDVLSMLDTAFIFSTIVLQGWYSHIALPSHIGSSQEMNHRLLHVPESDLSIYPTSTLCIGWRGGQMQNIPVVENYCLAYSSLSLPFSIEKRLEDSGKWLLQESCTANP